MHTHGLEAFCITAYMHDSIDMLHDLWTSSAELMNGQLGQDLEDLILEVMHRSFINASLA